MIDSGDRRAVQKARTRERIRVTAQELFAGSGFDAVPIAGIAAAAGVSVQTVFNHFAGKEDLFFTERVPWVAGPAAAIRNREPQVQPLRALHEHLVGMVADYARLAATPGHQRLIAVLEASPALLAHERGLHEEAVRRLGAALAEVCEPVRVPGRRPTLAADVTAAMWLGAVRTVLLDLRAAPPAAGDEDAIRTAGDLVGDVLDGLGRCAPIGAADVRGRVA